MNVLAIASATFFGVRFAVSEGKEIIRDEIKPLVDRVEKLEKQYVSLDEIMSMNNDGLRAVEVSVTHFIDNYNKVHHTAFLKPNDIELTTSVKKRRR